MTETHIDGDNGLSGADLKARRIRRYEFITNMFGGAVLSSIFFNSFDFVPPMSLVYALGFPYLFFVAYGWYHDHN